MRARALPFMLGASFLPLACGAQVVAATDDEVIRGWQAAMPGAPVPVLVPEGQGTRLAWTGSATLDAYGTRVRSGSGHVGSPLADGEFGKAAFHGDARWVRPDGTVDALMFRTLHSNDRAVLPRTAYQVGNLQAARTASWYSLAAGDVAPNFSKLSSSLGARGALGQATVGPATVSGFMGQVAESWEALGRPSLRTQPVRSVHGAKVEVPVGASTRLHATTQHYREERRGTGDGHPLPADARSRNSTAGLQFSQGDFSVAAEVAASRLADDAQGDRSGEAAVVDGSWRIGSGALRFGAHSIDTGYTSLAQGAMPGVEEAYLAGEWPLFAWLSLGGDVRRSRNTTAATPFGESYTTRTDAAGFNASVQFGPEWPGWSLALQRAVSQSRAPGDQLQGNEATSIGLSYYGPAWALQLTHSRNEVENSSFPAGDSVTSGWNWSVRRSWSAPAAGGWSTSLGFTGRTQVQRLASGQRADAADAGLQFATERPGVLAIAVTAAAGAIAQSQDAPSVHTRSLQIDATVPLRAGAQVKVYARYNTRRGADAALELDEKTVGVQLTAPF